MGQNDPLLLAANQISKEAERGDAYLKALMEIRSFLGSWDEGWDAVDVVKAIRQVIVNVDFGE
jgi:hypothetical protein